MIKPQKPNDNLHSDKSICESQNYRQIAEIKKLKSELSCRKYCYKYDDIIQLGGIIILVFTASIFVFMHVIVIVLNAFVMDC
jgi:hypothetical protein